MGIIAPLAMIPLFLLANLTGAGWRLYHFGTPK